MCSQKPREDRNRECTLPFTNRLAPRKPPPAHLDGDPDTLNKVSEYMNSTDDSFSEAVAWLDHLSRDATFQGLTALDLQLLAVFFLVRQDTVVFLERIDRILDEISSGSMDERMMQEQLGHWRTLLSRFQNELPALDKSIRVFFAFPYQDGEPPSQLSAALATLRADIKTTAGKCETLQQSLRAEMSLVESKRGIEEAESVSRLTELAFLFIPMTFAASLFSMQLQELADNPPPVYSFVITAVVIVAVSYGLRLVQRSTVVGDLRRNIAQQIRNDQQVAAKDIPIRTIISWGAWKMRGKPLIVAASSACLVLLLTPLWTRAAMDESFKGVITGLILLTFLATLLALLSANSPRTPRFRPTNTFGFGRVWENPVSVSGGPSAEDTDGERVSDSVIHV